jgi:predicted regulator of Ras-like GTPase activity (Roadblock/LC7/MglB family)
LLSANPEGKEAAKVSAEGLPIASVPSSNGNEKRMLAMTAALLSLSERAVLEMEKGEFEQLYVKGNDGSFRLQRKT